MVCGRDERVHLQGKGWLGLGRGADSAAGREGRGCWGCEGRATPLEKTTRQSELVKVQN